MNQLQLEALAHALPRDARDIVFGPEGMPELCFNSEIAVEQTIGYCPPRKSFIEVKVTTKRGKHNLWYACATIVKS